MNASFPDFLHFLEISFLSCLESFASKHSIEYQTGDCRSLLASIIAFRQNHPEELETKPFPQQWLVTAKKALNGCHHKQVTLAVFGQAVELVVKTMDLFYEVGLCKSNQGNDLQHRWKLVCAGKDLSTNPYFDGVILDLSTFQICKQDPVSGDTLAPYPLILEILNLSPTDLEKPSGFVQFLDDQHGVRPEKFEVVGSSCFLHFKTLSEITALTSSPLKRQGRELQLVYQKPTTTPSLFSVIALGVSGPDLEAPQNFATSVVESLGFEPETCELVKNFASSDPILDQQDVLLLCFKTEAQVKELLQDPFKRRGQLIKFIFLKPEAPPPPPKEPSKILFFDLPEVLLKEDALKDRLEDVAGPFEATFTINNEKSQVLVSLQDPLKITSEVFKHKGVVLAFKELIHTTIHFWPTQCVPVDPSDLISRFRDETGLELDSCHQGSKVPQCLVGTIDSGFPKDTESFKLRQQKIVLVEATPFAVIAKIRSVGVSGWKIPQGNLESEIRKLVELAAIVLIEDKGEQYGIVYLKTQEALDRLVASGKINIPTLVAPQIPQTVQQSPASQTLQPGSERRSLIIHPSVPTTFQHEFLSKLELLTGDHLELTTTHVSTKKTESWCLLLSIQAFNFRDVSYSFKDPSGLSQIVSFKSSLIRFLNWKKKEFLLELAEGLDVSLFIPPIPEKAREPRNPPSQQAANSSPKPTNSSPKPTNSSPVKAKSFQRNQPNSQRPQQQKNQPNNQRPQQQNQPNQKKKQEGANYTRMVLYLTQDQNGSLTKAVEELQPYFPAKTASPRSYPKAFISEGFLLECKDNQKKSWFLTFKKEISGECKEILCQSAASPVGPTGVSFTLDGDSELVKSFRKRLESFLSLIVSKSFFLVLKDDQESEIKKICQSENVLLTLTPSKDGQDITILGRKDEIESAETQIGLVADSGLCEVVDLNPRKKFSFFWHLFESELVGDPQVNVRPDFRKSKIFLKGDRDASSNKRKQIDDLFQTIVCVKRDIDIPVLQRDFFNQYLKLQIPDSDARWSLEQKPESNTVSLQIWCRKMDQKRMSLGIGMIECCVTPVGQNEQELQVIRQSKNDVEACGGFLTLLKSRKFLLVAFQRDIFDLALAKLKSNVSEQITVKRTLKLDVNQARFLSYHKNFCMNQLSGIHRVRCDVNQKNPKQGIFTDTLQLTGQKRQVEQAQAILRETFLNQKMVESTWRCPIDELDLEELEEKTQVLLESNVVVIRPKKADPSRPLILYLHGLEDAALEEATKVLDSLRCPAVPWTPESSVFSALSKILGKNKNFANEIGVSRITTGPLCSLLITVKKGQTPLEEVQKDLIERAKDTAIISRTFGVRRLIKDLLEWNKELKSQILSLSQPSVTTRLQGKTLYLRGTEANTLKAEAVLVEFIQKLNEKVQTKRISRPLGELELLKKDKWTLCEKIQNQIGGVYMRIPSRSNQEFGGPGSLTRWKTKLNGVTIQIVQGTILEEKVCAIVNAANERLAHDGGIAKDIQKYAGNDLVSACQQYISTSGLVPVGGCVHTTAGRLPCKHVIHTVGPIWKGGNSGEAGLLEDAITNTLKLAEDLNLNSISIPGISSGIFGIAKEFVAERILSAIALYLHDVQASSIKVIRLIDLSEEMIQAWLDKADLIDPKKKSCSPRFQKPAGAPSAAFYWQWQENDGNFIDFDPDQSYQIEFGYHNCEERPEIEVVGDLQMQQNGAKYLVNFTKMTEVNTQYMRNYRPIQRVRIEQKNVVVWEVRTVQGWEELDNAPQIEKAFQGKDVFPQIKIRFKDEDCFVVFGDDERHLLNRKDGTQRKVRRTEIDAEDAFKQHVKKIQKKIIEAEEVQEEPLAEVQMGYLDFVGLSENVLVDIEERYKSFVSFLYKTVEIDALQLDPSSVSKLETLISSEFPGVDFSYESSKIILKGLECLLQSCHTSVLTFLFSESKNRGVTPRPKEWQQQDQEVLKLFDIPSGSSEWITVLNAMKVTIPSTVIHRLERIQHVPLWESYQGNLTQLKKKNSHMAPEDNEKWLFHGTRALDPSKIYTDEQGFDMRFCISGMWGVAQYFAVNASYSLNYSYSVPGTNQKQMFYVRVQTGDSAYIMPNVTALKKPPQKASKNQSSLVLYHDSVSGETNGSTVFMIYENYKSYPEYLITYTV